MENSFHIWIDRLKNGQIQKINESLPPSFLDVQEKELQFHSPVIVKGEAYLTESELVLHLDASTIAMMPCAICNKMSKIPLKIRDFYHTHPIEDIRSGIFDYRETLRETLLIELPLYVECNKGHCPERPTVAPYLHSEKKPEKENIHFPFSNLDS